MRGLDMVDCLKPSGAPERFTVLTSLYCDDIALLAKDTRSLTRLVEAIESVSGQLGVKMTKKGRDLDTDSKDDGASNK